MHFHRICAVMKFKMLYESRFFHVVDHSKAEDIIVG